MKRILFALVIISMLLLSAIVPVSAVEVEKIGLKVGDKEVLSPTTEAVYQGKTAEGEQIWTATIEAPKYLDDLTTPITCRWHFDTELIAWVTEVNLYYASVVRDAVTVQYEGSTMSWTPDVYIGGKEVTPFTTMPDLLLYDPINEEYIGNTLQWQYEGFTRNLRIIEGALLEYYVFDVLPTGAIRIVDNKIEDISFTYDRFCSAWDADYYSLPLTYDKSGFIELSLEAMQLATFPVTIDPITTFSSNAYDGSLNYWISTSPKEDSWDGAHDNTVASTIADAASVTRAYIRVQLTASYLTEIRRSFVVFDTSAIPDTASITAATLQLKVWQVNTECGGSDIIIQGGMPTYPHLPLVVGDYLYSHYSGDYGQVHTSSMTPTQYSTWTLTASGRAAISLTGITKFIIREEAHDEDDVQPGYYGDEDENGFGFYTYEGGSNSWPKLTVTYTNVAPVVSVSAATLVTDTTAKLHGAISDTGGDNPTVTVYWGDNNGGQTPASWDSNSAPTSPAQPQGVASFYKDTTGLSANTLHYFTARAVNTYGTSWAAVLSFTTHDIPTMTTDAASSIAKTTARLNGTVVDDGDGDVTVRFGWGLTSEATIEAYDDYDTVAGTFNTGEHPYLDVGSLTASTLYYFRAEGTNDEGTDLGGELDFTTLAAVADVTNFKAIPLATTVSLTWAIAEGASRYMIRYKIGSYPADETDGIEVYFSTSTSHMDNELTPGSTYYYGAWGESGGAYSVNGATVMVTTSAAVTGGEAFDAPISPARWLSAPDYTNLSGLLFVYDGINRSADSLGMPRETLWMILAVVLSMAIGVLVYMVSKGNLFMGIIGLTAGLVFGWIILIIPFWIPLVSGIVIVAYAIGHREVKAY